MEEERYNEPTSAEEAVTPEETSVPEVQAEPTPLNEAEQPVALAEPVSASEPPRDWAFGDTVAAAPTPEKTRGIPFFVMFLIAFGLCMLLFLAVLLFGDGKFEIIRNVMRERIIYVREDDGTSGLLTPNEAADRVRQSTVSIAVTTETGSGIGSGFVYSADGYIITHYHVIEDAKTVQVILPDGTAVDGVVKGYNVDADVAVVKINVTGLVPATLGVSADLLVGDDVVAIGTPAKLDYAGTATFGKVSATRRLLSITDASGSVTKKMTVIQTDTQVNPGNSGGPLADMYGNVIGVVVMKIIEQNDTVFEGMGFALPIDGVKEIADAIIATGSFTGKNPIVEGRSLLGVTGHGGKQGLWYADATNPDGTVPYSETEKAGYHYMWESGIYVMGVNGTNAIGKVKEGDIITAVNGLHVSDTRALIAAVNRYYAGERVTLTVYRGTQFVDVEILLYEEAFS